MSVLPSKIIETNFPFMGYKTPEEYGYAHGEQDHSEGNLLKYRPEIHISLTEFKQYKKGYQKALKEGKQ